MTFYKNGVISIPNVTGDVVIIATAVAQAAENLFIKTPSETATATASFDDVVSLGARINSSGGAVFRSNTMLVTRYIDAVYGDVITLKTDAANNLDQYAGSVAYYRSDGSFISQHTHTASLWTWDSEYKEGSFTVDSGSCAKIRLCVSFTDIDNIIVTKA